MDLNTRISDLTVREFMDLQSTIYKNNHTTIPVKHREVVHGLSGIANLFKCSKTEVGRMKAKGIFGTSLTQEGRKIVLDVERAFEAVRKYNDKKSKR